MRKLSKGRARKIKHNQQMALARRAMKRFNSASAYTREASYYARIYSDAIHHSDPIYQRMKLNERR